MVLTDKNLRIIIKDASWHRNGVSGVGFYAVLFTMSADDAPTREMVIALFDNDNYAAAFEISGLAAGDIAFGSNSWHGDRIAAAVRPELE